MNQAIQAARAAHAHVENEDVELGNRADAMNAVVRAMTRKGRNVDTVAPFGPEDIRIANMITLALARVDGSAAANVSASMTSPAPKDQKQNKPVLRAVEALNKTNEDENEDDKSS